MEDAMIQTVTIMGLIMRYLLQPTNLLLTFVLPIVVYFTSRRYVWLSIPLTAAIQLVAKWGEFTYYESRGLMILFTAAQLAVMALLILALKAVRAGREQR